MVDVVRSGCKPEEPACEFEPTEQSISTWVKQADRDAGCRQALSGRSWGAIDVRTIACVSSVAFPSKGGSLVRAEERARARTSLPVHEPRTRPCIPFVQWPGS